MFSNKENIEKEAFLDIFTKFIYGRLLFDH